MRKSLLLTLIILSLPIFPQSINGKAKIGGTAIARRSAAAPSPITVNTALDITGGVNGGTSGDITTTGVSLLVVGVGYYDGINELTLDDEHDGCSFPCNTWTPLTKAGNSNRPAKIFYAVNPSVGTGHHFRISGTTTFSSGCVLPINHAKTSSPYDAQESGAGGNGLSLSPGALTPSENGEILITVLGTDEGTTSSITIDSGFTKACTIGQVGGGALGSSLAYIIQTTATSKNPSWLTTQTAYGAVMAPFKQQP